MTPEERKEYMKQWYENNKIKVKEYRKNKREEINKTRRLYEINNKEELKTKRKKYRDANIDKIKKYGKEYRIATKEERRKYDKIYQFKKRYGITPEQYYEFLNKQNNSCAICGKHQSELKKALAVDHNHKTNKIRGLLCDRCNRGLGYFGEDKNIINNANNYLNMND